jgi:tetratricopeptide (TPR) repeat protein
MKNNKYSNYLRIAALAGFIIATTLTLVNKNVNADNENIEDKLFKKIEAAAGLNDLEKVKDDIKRVLKLNPKHAGAMFYAGKYCFQTGNFENAEKFLKRIIYDPVYGSKANAVLAQIRLKNYNSRFMSTLKVYLSGESFDQALKLCEEALSDMPDNKELLFSAAYASCMLGKKDKADTYTELYAVQTNNSPTSAELKTLVDAWFTDSFDSQVAIEKFLSLKSKNLLTPPVKRRIKDLLISSKSIDRYEDFIRKEASQPGADKDALERELITFLLQQNQYKKALEHINNRPIDSLDDNLLYIWALCATNQEIKALSTARTLMNVAPRDLRVYRAWVEAWLSYTDKNKNIPEGKDSNGKPYQETIDKLFQLLRPDKLITQEPYLLIDMLRMASFLNNDIDVQKLQAEVAKIAFTDEHEKILLKTADELMAFDRSRIAINILESAVNQLPDNYNVSLKLAQVYMNDNPSAAIRICEEVMEQHPELIRAFIMWCDAMNLANRGGEAVSELVKRLSDESLNDVVKRQLNIKLEELRIAGNSDTPYKGTEKRKEGHTYGDEPKNKDSQDEDIPGDDLLDTITGSDINSYTPPKEEEDNENLDY